MIGTIDIEIMAANPSMPLYPVRAFVNSPTSVRLRNVPRKVGKWNITSVQIVAAYPDSSIKTANCVLTGGVWVGTIEGCAISGTSENGFTVFASGIDENGNPVSNYVLGKGLIEILNADGTIHPDAPSYYVHLLEEEPAHPKEGDLYPTEDGYFIWQDGEAHGLGLTEEAIINIINDTVPSLIPSNVSDFNNDAGYITASAIPPIPSKTSDLTNDSGFITAQAIPSNVSSFNNDAGYVTASAVSDIVTERTQPIFGDWTVTPVVQGYWEISYDGNDTWSMTIAPDETEPPIAFVTAEGGEDATNLVFDGSVAGIPNYVATRSVTPSRNVLNLAMYQDLTSFATQDYVQAAIPSNISSFNNDAGYITSSDVTPLGGRYAGWAEKAFYTTTMMNTDPYNPTVLPNTLTACQIQNGVPLVATTTYLPWTLIYWDGTQLDPTVEIGNFRFFEKVTYKINNRPFYIVLNSFAWVSADATYIITAKQNDDGSFQPEKIGVRSNRTVTWYNITLSADQKSIVSVEGTTGLTECIRTGISQHSYRYLAYTDQIPTVPSDVSSFNNDAGYITASAIPSNISSFNNDAGYVTASVVSATYATKEDATLYLRGTNKDGFSDWTVYNTGDLTWTLNYVPQQSGWILQTFDGEGHNADTVLCVAPEDATYLDLSGIGGTLSYYATREHLYGYTLGSQDDKVIASPSYVESYVQTYVDAQIGTLLSTAF